VYGSLGKSAYRPESLRNREILDLARRVSYYVDPAYPGPGRFKGEVTITLKDGTNLYELEEYNRGSAENPMSYEEIRAKFDENACGFLAAARREKLTQSIRNLETLAEASELVSSAC
jgi:2-methylcitrate dehydratase PrpD